MREEYAKAAAAVYGTDAIVARYRSLYIYTSISISLYLFISMCICISISISIYESEMREEYAKAAAAVYGTDAIVARYTCTHIYIYTHIYTSLSLYIYI